MSLWFRRTQGLTTELLRECADTAGISWDYQIILYRGNAIGYKHGDTTDATAVKDELEKLLGYRPVVVDEPTVEADQTDQTQ
jgi:hypothetical protein